MKTPMLLALVGAFFIFSEKENDDRKRHFANELYHSALSSDQGAASININPPLGDRLFLRDQSFSNSKLSVKKYFVPENNLGIDNTGVILYYLEDRKSVQQAGDANYTRGISFVSECIGALSFEISYNSARKNIELKADVSDAYGTVDHLLDCSFNLNPCKVAPIASLLAKVRNTFGVGLGAWS